MMNSPMRFGAFNSGPSFGFGDFDQETSSMDLDDLSSFSSGDGIRLASIVEERKEPTQSTFSQNAGTFSSSPGKVDDFFSSMNKDPSHPISSTTRWSELSKKDIRQAFEGNWKQSKIGEISSVSSNSIKQVMAETLDPSLRQHKKKVLDPNDSVLPKNSSSFRSITGRGAETFVDARSKDFMACMANWEQGQEGVSGLFRGAGGAPPKRPTDPELVPLFEQGYTRLASFLEGHQGEPWDHIRRIKNPNLMEQLMDFFELCQFKSTTCDGEAIKNLLRFSLLIGAQAGTRAQKEDPYDATPTPESEKALAILGQLMFLTNKNLNQASGMVSDKDLPGSCEKLGRVFDEQVVQNIQVTIEKTKSMHDKTGLQPSDRAAKTRLPMVIAEHIVNDDGSINIGLIQPLVNAFTEGDEAHRNHKINLIYGLSTLARCPRLRNKLAKVCAPSQEDAPGAKLVRQTLLLPPGHKVSDVDAKKAAISAIASHLRQGPVGSCFATYLGIQLLLSRLGRCLDDFSCLIADGKLTRSVDGKKESFPYLMKTSQRATGEKITFDCKGRLTGKGYFPLFNAPGIQAALMTAGVRSSAVEEVVTATCSKYFKNPTTTSSETVSVRHFLEKLAEEIHGRMPAPKPKLKRLKNDMIFAFGSQVNHPILRVWENAIAGMSECRIDGIMKSTVIGTTLLISNYIVGQMLGGRQDLQQLTVLGIGSILLDRMRLQYDPCLEATEVARDGHSTSGAFVLYDTRGKAELADWKRVDTPEKWQRFVNSVISESVTTIRPLIKTRGNPVDAKPYRTAAEKMAAFSRLDDFSKICVQLMPGKKIKDPLANYEKLKFTPWVCKIGNNSHETMRVYLERNDIPDPEVFQPMHAEHLLTTLIDMGKENLEEVQKMFNRNPYHLVPVMTPGCHAFNLTLGEQSMRKAWENKEYTSKWVEDNVKAPGRKVAQTVVSDDCIKDIRKFVVEKVISKDKKKPKLYEEKCAKFNALMDKMPKNLWYSDFRNRVLTYIQQAEGPYQRDPQLLARKVDTQLFRSLPNEFKEPLLNSMIRFADPNWRGGAKVDGKTIEEDCWFTFLYNPFANELQVVLTLDSDHEIFVMDQRDWIEDQPWAFYNHLDLLPPDGDNGCKGKGPEIITSSSRPLRVQKRRPAWMPRV